MVQAGRVGKGQGGSHVAGVRGSYKKCFCSRKRTIRRAWALERGVENDPQVSHEGDLSAMVVVGCRV